MSLVLLVIHMMIAVALVGVVLLQKSEGGALGIGGGGGGFLTGRGTANLLTRTTAFLAAAFFASSLGLTMLAQHGAQSGSILDKPAPHVSAPAESGTSATPGDTAVKPADTPAAAGEGKPEGRGILDKLQAPAAPLPR